MQNSSPPSARPEFQKQAAMPEKQRIGLRVQEMRPHQQAQFHQIRERQELALKAEQSRLDKQRDATIAAVTQNLLDARAKQLSPSLTPKHLPKLDRNEMKRLARADATAQVRQMEQERLSGMEVKFIEDQTRFVERVESAERRAEFNRASREGLSQEFTRISNQGGHAR